ncbi:hypothetical protein [Geothrix sp. PMB-07]|uniref:hypothetical protein n=1 Tax=Geothrix sp. PMB-07 TaxID=3068640 RepID=UPI0027415815|nr:hypothetical protein [Geothrix sp. PMB-07]WLT30071.1 hypothetical protein Q9293_10115 [Geothrix sp. PMB-07]
MGVNYKIDQTIKIVSIDKKTRDEEKAKEDTAARLVAKQREARNQKLALYRFAHAAVRESFRSGVSFEGDMLDAEEFLRHLTDADRIFVYNAGGGAECITSSPVLLRILVSAYGTKAGTEGQAAPLPKSDVDKFGEAQLGRLIRSNHHISILAPKCKVWWSPEGRLENITGPVHHVHTDIVRREIYRWKVISLGLEGAASHFLNIIGKKERAMEWLMSLV